MQNLPDQAKRRLAWHVPHHIEMCRNGRHRLENPFSAAISTKERKSAPVGADAEVTLNPVPQWPKWKTYEDCSKSHPRNRA